MNFKVGDLVKRKVEKHQHEVGFVIKVFNNSDPLMIVRPGTMRGHFVRVQWTDGLKWNHLPDPVCW